MRMWGISPKLMCRAHLLGEHVEMHMFSGSIKKKISICGYLQKNLVNPYLIEKRHDALAKEMKRRGYAHKSPLHLSLPKNFPKGKINIHKNLAELSKRCTNCKILQKL
ncbi:hypothetical protein COU37_03745 [Candidatus Micrarchaeota archaeon CG10_big_fil_rev_8_21_14_0_10_45_29]|nr:MAG: hypothetical protein COU37_03745 [Candidatus Micrarchaeota archaeon CG10_big_fil_rev_8_21_14_0_10_45_29]